MHMSWFEILKNAVKPAKKDNKVHAGGEANESHNDDKPDQIMPPAPPTMPAQPTPPTMPPTMPPAMPAQPVPSAPPTMPAPQTPPAGPVPGMGIDKPSTHGTQLRPTKLAKKDKAISANNEAISRLSSREKEVFLFCMEGMKMKDIAVIMNIKTSTVNGYCRDIYRKLGVNSKTQLIIKYSEYKNVIK